MYFLLGPRIATSCRAVFVSDSGKFDNVKFVPRMLRSPCHLRKTKQSPDCTAKWPTNKVRISFTFAFCAWIEDEV